MKQQINLLQNAGKGDSAPLQARAALAVLGLLAVAVAAFAAWDSIRIGRLERQAQQLAAQQEAAAVRLAEYQQRFAPRPPSELLKKELARLETRLARRERLTAMLTSGAMGNSSGLSPYLEALARRHLEGTWYTRIAIDAGGTAIGLSGRSVAPELVPALVQRLAGEGSFSGISFSAMEIARRKAPARDVDFTMTTRGMDWSDADG
ncbi:MAG: PilN domain-containing protein [Gammaproteobacteria bacterium]|nr:PilN domain-containing protein [Gammaproteobacteria bacterium]NNM01725.1 PilN domain-containing protein [Gammaproteobacteria bacterium]